MKVIKKSFGIILTLSVISLILLVVGVFFLTKDNKKTFTKEGYIISYKSGDTSVYSFKEGVSYKYNVNGDLVFKDSKSNKVVASLDNFVHYANGDISFLKNGVLLNLENVNDNVVPYYNITNKSLLEFNNDSFNIKNINGDLNINKFIGRISDNKYIVSCKNITAKLSGNNEVITSSSLGNFFEITYAENGVVVITDGENTHTVTADKSYIYINEDTVISLGDKNIFYKDEQKLSLNQLTIDGDENIDIIPPEEDEKIKIEKEEEEKRKALEEEQNRIQQQLAEIARQQRENALVEENAKTKEENAKLEAEKARLEAELKKIEAEKKKLEEDKKNDSNSDNKQEEVVVSVTKNPVFRVVKAVVGANKLELDIDVIDEYNVIDGNLNVSIINMKTGNSVYSDTISDISNLVKIATPSGTLSPKTNYIVSITGNYKNEDISYNKQFFQRVFVTDEIGIKMYKEYVTSSNISVSVDVDDTLIVKEFDLTLYDLEDNEIEKKSVDVVGSTNNVLFDNLNSNTEYKVVLNNIVYNNVVYTDSDSDNSYRDGDYTLIDKYKTLKKIPIVNDIKATVNDDKTKVEFKINSVVDNDKAITGYKYYIYEYDNVTGIGGSDPVMDPISKKDASAFNVNIDGVNIKSGQSYRYMVVVEYNDNEKDVEYNSGFSNSFVAGAVPSVSFSKDNDRTTFNTLVGTIKMTDNNCTVPINGRECDSRYNNIFVKFCETGSTTEECSSIVADFDPVTLSYNFSSTGLKENTNYKIEVFGGVDFKDGNGIHACSSQLYEDGECIQIGQSMNASTKSVVPITVEWGNDKLSVESQVFSLGGNRLKSTNNSNAERDSIANLSLNVYASNTENIDDGVLISTVNKNSNIKNEFFDNEFAIKAIETFNMDIDTLKSKTKGLLTKYYIFEITDASDSAAVNKIPIENNTYAFEINSSLRADDILGDPWMDVEVRKINDIDSRAVVTANYDAANLGLLFPDASFSIVMGACNISEGACSSSSNDWFDLEAVVLDELTGSYTNTFNVIDGTDYNKDDGINNNDNIVLRRGNKYKFRFNIIVNDGSGSLYYYPGKDKISYVESSLIKFAKGDELFYINPVSSTENSITYNYYILDSDRVLYKDESDDNYSLYYKIDDVEHKVDILSGNKFSNNGSFTISGLSNNKNYSIYYKTAKEKNNDVINDVKVSYEKKFRFDGFYDLDDYGLRFKLENNEVSNKITVKILNTPNVNDILSRVSLYSIQIKEGNNILKSKYVDSLNDCVNDDCVKYFDYHYSEFEGHKNKTLSVKVYAYYDSGLIGTESQNGYIIQQNNLEDSYGKYVIYGSGNSLIESDKPYGVYYYELKQDAFDLYSLVNNYKLYSFNYAKNNYQSLNLKHNFNLHLTRTNEGNKYGNYTVNFKSIDMKEIAVDGNNTFSFSSITPDISTSYDPIINGADISINTISITGEVLDRNFIKENDKYYFYVELYDSLNNKLDTKSVEINPGSNTDLTFDNLADDTTYIYKVFAKLNKNGESYIQLNDTNSCETLSCVPVNYEFNTLKGSDLFGDLNVSYKSFSSEEKYKNRELNLKLNLNSELKNVRKNYDLIVNLIENGVVVDTKTINNEDLVNSMDIDFDITDYDAIYGTDYFKVELVAVTSVNSASANVVIYNEFIELNELKMPTISVTKSAKTEIIESDYVYSLEFNVAINDVDKVISNGKYKAVLMDNNQYDENNNKLIIKTIDDLEINLDNEGRATLLFTSKDDMDANKNIRPDREYMLEISFETYTNNESLRQESIDNIRQDNKYNYRIYTSGIYGISLGEVSIVGTSDSVIMNFYSSANIENLDKIEYSITKESQSKPVSQGEFIIGEDINFIYNEGSNNDKYYSLTLEKDDIVLNKDTVYLLSFQFYVKENDVYMPIATGSNSKYITMR